MTCYTKVLVLADKIHKICPDNLYPTQGMQLNIYLSIYLLNLSYLCNPSKSINLHLSILNTYLTIYLLLFLSIYLSRCWTDSKISRAFCWGDRPWPIAPLWRGFILPLRGSHHTKEFSKRVREVLSQLFVTLYTISIYLSVHKQLKRRLTIPFREFPCIYLFYKLYKFVSHNSFSCNSVSKKKFIVRKVLIPFSFKIFSP